MNLVDQQIFVHIHHRQMGGFDRLHRCLQICQIGRQPDGAGKTDGQLVQLRLLHHFDLPVIISLGHTLEQLCRYRPRTTELGADHRAAVIFAFGSIGWQPEKALPSG
ncbi:hypothetical protein D3C75_876520 [compost metagenome]